jgi:hypothetical protein
VVSGFPKPLPSRWFKRVSEATSFYVAFRPLFRQVGRWCTGIPSEPKAQCPDTSIIVPKPTLRDLRC